MSKHQTDHAVLRWDFIEKIANNELSKIVGVIPIVGYLILFNDGLTSSISFNTLVGSSDDTETPFLLSNVFKLRLTFFGSLFILLANLAFKLRAPEVLSHSKTDIEFSNKVAESYSAAEIHEIERQVASESWIRRTSIAGDEILFDSRMKSGVLRLSGMKEKRFIMRDNAELVRALAREWWMSEVHSRTMTRWITLGCCVLGYLMLAIPTIDIAQAVVRDLF